MKSQQTHENQPLRTVFATQRTSHKELLLPSNYFKNSSKQNFRRAISLKATRPLQDAGASRAQAQALKAFEDIG